MPKPKPTQDVEFTLDVEPCSYDLSPDGRLIRLTCPPDMIYSIYNAVYWAAHRAGLKLDPDILKGQLAKCQRHVEELQQELDRCRGAGRSAIEKIREKILAIARKLDVEISSLESIDDLVAAVSAIKQRLETASTAVLEAERQLREAFTEAIIVTYRLPHEEARAKVEIERNGGTYIVKRVVDANFAKTARMARKLISNAVENCIRLDAGAYLCHPSSTAVLENAFRRIRQLYARFHLPPLLWINKIYIAKKDLIEHIKRELILAKEDLEAAESKLEELRRERKRYDHWLRKAQELRHKIQFLEKWLQELQ